MIELKEIDLTIGTRFITKNVQLEVVESDLCADCYYFDNKRADCNSSNLNCYGPYRSDHKSVVFKQVGTIKNITAPDKI